MFDATAPILEVGHSYVIGESQRGLLQTNDIALVPVMGFMAMGELTESVLYRGYETEEFGSFLNKVHSGQLHVGEVLMFTGRSRVDLNPGLAALYQVNTWPVVIGGCFMVCAEGFMLSMFSGSYETFEGGARHQQPMIHHYQLCWVDREGRHHAFTDIVEVL